MAKKPSALRNATEMPLTAFIPEKQPTKAKTRKFVFVVG